MANCLMLLTKVGESSRERVLKSGGFKCKSCNRQFLSFQALGGHRASHKKIKLMASNLSCSTMKPKMHRCPICGLEFAIGQALGGHMGKHRAALSNGFSFFHHAMPNSNATKTVGFCLDLNLTPYENDQNLNLGHLY
ncbi:hypothetical protein VNO77_36393 [Canavalia gladiata]|uniref:C2H2-type domain-containing protein n=1 Tax=Canavalia gladiata TaxID=3824 RepID=A0AAN9K7U5_CANGL